MSHRKMEVQLERIRADLIGECRKSNRLATLRLLSSIIQESSGTADIIADTLGRILCQGLADEVSDSCITVLIELLIELINRITSDELKKCLSQLVVHSVMNRTTFPDSEHARIGCSLLIAGVSKHTSIPPELVKQFATDRCTEVILNCLSFERFDLNSLDDIVRLLNHKSSKVRIATIGVVDKFFMRAEPWKSTYSVVSKLAAIEGNDIPVSEFFNPSTHVNYMSRLTFDGNLKVRTMWFRQLVDWTVSLEDRSDVDIHFCPYILTGTFDSDPGLSKQVTCWIETEIDVDTWIRKSSRRFIQPFMRKLDCDFQECSTKNVLNMLRTIVQYMNSDGLVEWLPDILSVYARTYERESELCDDIITLLGKKISPEIWYDVIPIEPTDPMYWRIVDRLLTSDEIPEQVADYFASKMADLRKPKLHAISVFDKIWKFAQNNFLALAWSSLVIGKSRILLDSREHFSIDLFTDSLKQNEALTTPRIVLEYVSLLDSANLHSDIVELIKTRRMIDGPILEKIFQKDPKAHQGMLCYFLACPQLSEPEEDCVHASIMSTDPKNMMTELVDLLVAKNVSLRSLECWNHISGRLTQVQATRIFNSIKASDLIQDHSFPLAFGRFVLKAIHRTLVFPLSEITDLFIPALLDSTKEESQTLELTVKEIMNFYVSESPHLFIAHYLEVDEKGYIARSVYLSQFIRLT